MVKERGGKIGSSGKAGKERYVMRSEEEAGKDSE